MSRRKSEIIKPGRPSGPRSRRSYSPRVAGGKVMTPADLRLLHKCTLHDKVRHFVSCAGDVWQVDVYEGLLDGVVLAEI
jgi:CYTH domain-containing protein